MTLLTPYSGYPDYQADPTRLSLAYVTTQVCSHSFFSAFTNFLTPNYDNLIIEVGECVAPISVQLKQATTSTFPTAQPTWRHDVPAGQNVFARIPTYHDYNGLSVRCGGVNDVAVTVYAAGTRVAGPRYLVDPSTPILDTDADSVAGGATETLEQRYPYAGPAVWSIRTAATVWSAVLYGQEYDGTDHFVAAANSTVDGNAFRTFVELPPLILRCAFTNGDVGAKTYSAALVAQNLYT